MKKVYTIPTLLIATLLLSVECFSKDKPQLLQGPYMGQTLPGTTPKVFAPGVVSTEQRDYSGFFSPDMQEFYFTRRNAETGKWSLIGFHNRDNQWHQFMEVPRVGRPIFAPDGKTMHLGKNYMQRMVNGWSEIKSLGPMFDRDDWYIMRLSSSAKGTYVLDDARGGDVIRMSKLKDGVRQAPEKMGPMVNTGKWTAHPFIAPDESYLIWDSEREEGYGDSDLYISFQQPDGSWGQAINLGDKINTSAWEASGYISPDGKYLFFNRHTENGEGSIFWVAADFIETLRAKDSSK